MYFLHDFIILAIGSLSYRYPVEFLILLLVLVNPLDLIRVFMLLQIDVPILMNPSSVFLREYLGESSSIFLVVGITFFWIGAFLWGALRNMAKKDF